MAGGSPRPTAPAMPWEQTWPAAAPDPQLPHCHENQNGCRQPRAHSSRNAPTIKMAGGSPGTTAPAIPWQPTSPPGSPGPTAPAMSQEPTWLAADPGPQVLPCPGNQHGRRHPRAYSSRHALGTNITDQEPGPTAPAMTRKSTWPAGASGPQLPQCLGTNMADRQPQAHSLRHAPRTNMAAQQPRAHTSRLATGTNMADQEPWPHRSCHDPGTNMAGAVPSPQLQPCTGNQHGGRQHQAQSSHQALRTNMATWQTRAHSSRHAPGTNMAGAVPSPQLPPRPGN